MHPLTPDLSQLSDDELHKKVSELTTKLSQSYRFANYELAGQVHMILDDFQAEMTRRQQKALDDLSAKSGQFDKIIDIK
jgi:hypothetical protein